MIPQRIESGMPETITKALANAEFEAAKLGFAFGASFLFKKFPTGFRVTICTNPTWTREERQKVLALIRGACESELKR